MLEIVILLLNYLVQYVFQIDKAEDLNLSVFNIIPGINESKTLHISCECKCKFNGTKCNSNQWWNNTKCQCECKKGSVFCVYIFNFTTHFQFILSILICFIFVLWNGNKCYFFNDIINIKNCGLNNIKSHKMKSHTKIFLFTILDMWQSKNM